MSTTRRSGRASRAPPDRDESLLPLTERRRVSGHALGTPAAGDVADAEQNNPVDAPVSTLDTAAGSVEHGSNGSVTNVSSSLSADGLAAAGKSPELLADSGLKKSCDRFRTRGR